MDSYFFVPGNRLHKINEILKGYSSHIVIDMEDSVKESARNSILEQLEINSDFHNHFIRIPLYNTSDENLDPSILKKLLELGYTNFIFPKLQSLKDFENLRFIFEKTKVGIIILIENTRLFLEMKALLDKYSSYIVGIGIGSHDFMSEVGGEHTLLNLEYPRQHILYLARMANIKAIDIASMELNSAKVLENEIKDGFQKGYDAKFFIHPWQLEILNKIRFYSREDYDWAVTIQKELNRAGNSKEFSPIIFEGQIIERPHLERVMKILKFYKNES
jgi:citrate lyase beta subunit